MTIGNYITYLQDIRRYSPRTVSLYRDALAGFADWAGASGEADLSPLLNTGRPVHRLAADSPLPITLDYATPQTLGPDRIAAACGAWALFPGTDCIIIDADKATTAATIKYFFFIILVILC